MTLPRPLCHAVLGLALVSAAMPLRAGDGDADASFGNQGRAIRSWPSDTLASETNAVATGTDGSVFVAGWRSFPVPQQRDAITLLKFRADGSPDSSFGAAGAAQFDLDPNSQVGESAVGVFALTGGRSLVLATRPVAGSMGGQPVLLSVRADGSLDPAFGSNGVRAIDISRWAGSDVQIRAACMTTDGRIVMAGALVGDDNADALVARVLPNGDVDVAFGDQGWTRIGSDEPLIARAVALDDVGRVIVAGNTLGSGVPGRPMVARLGTNGLPDASFGVGGLVRVNTGFSGSWRADAIVGGVRTITGGFIQRRLFLAISRTSPRATGVFALANDGSIATTFGNAGFVDLSLEEGSGITTLAMRHDLRLVAAGWIDPNGTGRSDFLVARMAFDGTPDTSFDGNGRARYPINVDGNTYDTPSAMVLSGERPVIAGDVYNNLTPSYHTAVLRLSSDLIFRQGFE